MPIDYDGTHTSSERTYFASTPNSLVCAAGTKSFFVIMGSETKIIKVTRIHLTGLTMTARAYNNIALRKISSIPSGGTSSSLVKTSCDIINPASTVSVCKVYTVEPTTDGTLIGTIQSHRVQINDSNPVQGDPQQEIVSDFREYDESSGIVLRGINDGLTIAFGSTPASAITLSLEVEWIEID